MRYAVWSVFQCTLLVIGFLFSSMAYTQQLTTDIVYFVKPSCASPSANKKTQEDQFFFQLEITSVTQASHLEVVVDGEPLIQFHVTENDLPYIKDVGPFRHSGIGGSYHEYILRSLDETTADTLFLPEVLCGYGTHNGENRPGYYCDGTTAGVIAQATPEGLSLPTLPEKMYIYVLLHRITKLVVAKNFSGHFANVEDLDKYEIHAFATAFDESADFINIVTIGAELDQKNLFVCHAFCGVFNVDPDCSSFDLSLTKSVRDGTVYSFGDTVTFDITVTNEGSVTAYNVEVLDDLPSGLLFSHALNPEWEEDITSIRVDSILTSSSITIPIHLIVDASGGFVDIVNIAEIISATLSPDRIIPAFDIDSKPDNKISEEDDQDDAEIIIIENLCNRSFAVRLIRKPSCEGEDIIFSPEVMMANEPVVFRWRYNGDVISRSQELVLSSDQVDPQGVYQLTAIDNMGCVFVQSVPVNMIDNENRFGCYNDLVVGIGDNCKINMLPEMFTGRDVSGIEDYIIEIRDAEGEIVNEDDLSGYPPGTVFEARIINPCSGDVICWTNLHIENKLIPEYAYYNDDVFESFCTASYTSPSEYIDDYNLVSSQQILSALQFQDSLNLELCVQEWEVDIIDAFESPSQMCEDITVIRIYQIFDQERAIPLDTAFLIVKRLTVDDIVFPSDIDNIQCGALTDPLSLNSSPYILYNGDSILLRPNDLGEYDEPFCGMGIKYVDEQHGVDCVWGAKKIQRTWTMLDWCSNGSSKQTQFLYIIDREPPTITSTHDTIRITTDPYSCHANIRPSGYVTTEDNCNSVPSFLQGNEIIELPIGTTIRRVVIADACSNQSSIELVFVVIESTPPVPILNEQLTLSFTTDTIYTDHFIEANVFDAGSHDSECGPVTIEIARWAEVDIIERNGGVILVSQELYNCNNTTEHDDNHDGRVSVSEIFRDRIDICCQDIGSTIKVIVLITDLSGNQTRAEAFLEVVTKLTWTSCDDDNPCTYNDRSYGDCGCQGVPETRDMDNDGVLDCNDDEIFICLNNKTVITPYEYLDSLLAIGAIGGRCNIGTDGPVAMIAGSVYTPQGDMINDVEIWINSDLGDMTDDQGQYVLPDQPMYQRYELEPYNDDAPLNGVSAIDLVILQEYILGLRDITDPYQLIAADVNSDGRISGLDVIDMQKLLLGKSDVWRNNRSWRFVIKDYEWDDIRKPWTYQEVNVIRSLDQDMMKEDWIGIKTGDLSGDVRLENDQKSSTRGSDVWTMTTSNQEVTKGETVEIVLHSVHTEDEIKALQLEFYFDDLEVVGMKSGSVDISSHQFNLEVPENDHLQLIWTNTDGVEVDDIIFVLELLVNEDGNLEDMIHLADNESQLVYFVDDNSAKVNLEFNNIQPDLLEYHTLRSKVYQNQPNPFTGQTVIQFEIPHSGRVQFDFYTVSGRHLLSIDETYGMGNNAISLSHQDLQLYSGAIYYQMTFGQEKYTRTMVIGK